MNWFTDIIIAASLFSIVSLLDKYWGSTRFQSILSYSFVSYCASLLIMIIFIPLLDFSRITTISFTWTLVYAPVYFFMWLFWFKSLSLGDVSRNTAVFNIAPILTFILQLFIFHESILFHQILAIFFVVAGVIFITLKREYKRETTIAYMYVIGAAILSAIGNIVSKKAIPTIGPVNFFFISYVAMTPLYIYLWLKPQVASGIKKQLKNSNIYLPLFIRALFFISATYLYFHSLLNGPVSLVAAINGSRPAFVFILSIFITIFFPLIPKETLSKKQLFIKLFGITLTCVGVGLIYIN